MLQFEELMLTLRNMKPDMDDLKEALGYDKLTAEIAELEQKAAAPDFWDDMENSRGSPGFLGRYGKLAEGAQAHRHTEKQGVRL